MARPKTNKRKSDKKSFFTRKVFGGDNNNCSQNLPGLYDVFASTNIFNPVSSYEYLKLFRLRYS